MHGKIKNGLKALKLNKGSSIVMVVITMLFVAVLGSILLFSTYTGVMVKSTEQKGKQNFYDAQSAMNIVRAGVQELVNEAIKTAYPQVLINAGNVEDLSKLTDDFQDKFRQEFLAGIWLEDPLFTQNPTLNTYTYNLEEIEKYVASVTGIEVADLNSVGGLTFTGLGNVTQENGKLILEDLEIEHVNTGNKFTTSVKSDIVVNMPDFEYNYTPYSVTSITGFIFVVSEQFTSMSPELNFNSNAYFGNVLMSSTGAELNFNEGAIICKNDVTTDNGATINVGENVDIWANEISVQNGSNLFLSGNAYVYDDLTLGKDTNVNIAGTYIGYMSGSTPSESSAILVNDTGNSLDLKNVERLVLAGHGYVGGYDEFSGVENSGVQTGESLAVKSNQIAYIVSTTDLEVSFVDDSELEKAGSFTNPYIFDASESLPTLTLKVDSISPTGNTYASYGLTADSVQREVHHLANDNYVAYYFLDFANDEQARDYFTDYYSKNAALEGYMDTYFENLGGAPVETSFAPGVTFNEVANADFDIVNPINNFENVGGYSTIFENLTSTLTSDDRGGGDVYDNTVDTDAIAEFIEEQGITTFPDRPVEFVNAAGDVVALLVDEDYMITGTSTPSTVKLIVSYDEDDASVKTMNVFGNFEGLIMTDGNLTVSGANTVSSNTQAVLDALLAEYNGINIGTFLDFATPDVHIEDFSGGAWDLNLLVEYDNWTKN